MVGDHDHDGIPDSVDPDFIHSHHHNSPNASFYYGDTEMAVHTMPNQTGSGVHHYHHHYHGRYRRYHRFSSETLRKAYPHRNTITVLSIVFLICGLIAFFSFPLVGILLATSSAAGPLFVIILVPALFFMLCCVGGFCLSNLGYQARHFNPNGPTAATVGSGGVSVLSPPQPYVPSQGMQYAAPYPPATSFSSFQPQPIGPPPAFGMTASGMVEPTLAHPPPSYDKVMGRQQ